MPRYHIGLALDCPLEAVVLGGQSFQKFSWVFNDDGSYSKQQGLVIDVDHPLEPTGKPVEGWDYKGAILRDASPFVIRATQKDGKLLRADLFDNRIPGIYRKDAKRDLPLSDFVYVKEVEADFRATPETLTKSPAPALDKKPEAVAARATTRPPVPAQDVMTPEDLAAD